MDSYPWLRTLLDWSHSSALTVKDRFAPLDGAPPARDGEGVSRPGSNRRGGRHPHQLLRVERAGGEAEGLEKDYAEKDAECLLQECGPRLGLTVMAS